MPLALLHQPAEHPSAGHEHQMPFGTAGNKSWHTATLTPTWPWRGLSLQGGCSPLSPYLLHSSLQLEGAAAAEAARATPVQLD